MYRGGRPAVPVRGRDVIVIDDGLATGVTARAALRAVRAAGARRTVLAVPVAAPSSAAAMQAEADLVVVLAAPAAFRAVGEWYQSFGQLRDADVIGLLAAGGPGPRPRGGARSGRGSGQARVRRAYAALARRIRRRRSEARSSSFSPPQVPYFSGRDTA